jgi:hypothetical protein
MGPDRRRQRLFIRKMGLTSISQAKMGHGVKAFILRSMLAIRVLATHIQYLDYLKLIKCFLPML